MAMTINTNVMSLNAQRNASTTNSAVATAMQRLSSGLRVNSAKDDAAGLAIAERMQSQVRGMNVAIRNANDAVSLAQTAEGALGKLSDNLQRMRELAVQSRNATNTDEDRASLQKEFGQLQAEIKRTIDGTSFNDKKLFDGSTATFSFQVGANTSAQDRIDVAGVDLVGLAGDGSGALDLTVAAYTSAAGFEGNLLATSYTDLSTSASGGNTGVAIGGYVNGDTAGSRVTTSQIDTAIQVIDKSLNAVNSVRATFGAAQNRFEAVISSLQINAENTAASRGRITDADFAQETANLSRAQILQQAGSAMIAQANQQPQQVLALLRNF